MKYTKIILFGLFLPLLASASANTQLTLEVSDLTREWKYVPNPQVSEEFMPSGVDGNFVFTPGGIPGVEAKRINVALPKTALAEQVQPWHDLMFSGPKLHGIFIRKETVFNVRGQWRYYIEFQTQNTLQANTAMMATVIDGHLYVLVLDVTLAEYARAFPEMRNLVKTVDLKLIAGSKSNAH